MEAPQITFSRKTRMPNSQREQKKQDSPDERADGKAGQDIPRKAVRSRKPNPALDWCRSCRAHTYSRRVENAHSDTRNFHRICGYCKARVRSADDARSLSRVSGWIAVATGAPTLAGLGFVLTIAPLDTLSDWLNLVLILSLPGILVLGFFGVPFLIYQDAARLHREWKQWAIQIRQKADKQTGG